MSALLIDIGAVPADHCDHCLDDMHKAMAEEPDGRSEAIWAPHENPMIRDHVEDVTQRFQAILQAIQDAFSRALLGEPIGDLLKADVPWERWDETAFERSRARLESKPTRRYTLDDWLMLVDYLLQRYLNDGVINTEAEYLTVRAALAGKIEAAMYRPRGNEPELAIAIADATPTSLGMLPPKILTPLEHAMLLSAKEYAATNISSISAKARARMRTIIVEHFQAQLFGARDGQHERMRQRLFDEFGQLNRDFRRIAVTEAGEAVNSGFIAAQRPGSKVRRQEAYKGACPFCKAINGKVFIVVRPSQPDKNGDTDVWVGKSNIGRSASPRRRAEGGLVERPSNEMWWPAAGVQHPHCRGSWLPIADTPQGVSKEFASWLDNLIETKGGPAGKREDER